MHIIITKLSWHTQNGTYHSCLVIDAIVETTLRINAITTICVYLIISTDMTTIVWLWLKVIHSVFIYMRACTPLNLEDRMHPIFRSFFAHSHGCSSPIQAPEQNPCNRSWVSVFIRLHVPQILCDYCVCVHLCVYNYARMFAFLQLYYSSYKSIIGSGGCGGMYDLRGSYTIMWTRLHTCDYFLCLDLYHCSLVIEDPAVYLDNYVLMTFVVLVCFCSVLLGSWSLGDWATNWANWNGFAFSKLALTVETFTVIYLLTMHVRLCEMCYCWMTS